MTMKIGAVTLDCNDIEALGSFYERLTGRTTRTYSNPQYLELVDPEGGLGLVLQKVEEPKSVKNRAHIDFLVADIEREAARAVELGATYVKKFHGDDGWIWMTDPEGNEFCLCQEDERNP